MKANANAITIVVVFLAFNLYFFSHVFYDAGMPLDSILAAVGETVLSIALFLLVFGAAVLGIYQLLKANPLRGRLEWVWNVEKTSSDEYAGAVKALVVLGWKRHKRDAAAGGGAKPAIPDIGEEDRNEC